MEQVPAAQGSALVERYRLAWPSHSFLHRLPEPARDMFLSAGDVVRYRNKQVLIEEGQSGASVFLLVSACVKVTARLDGGGDALLAIRVGGDVVGEIAAMDGGTRMATVSACGREQVLAVRVARERFRDLLGHEAGAAVLLNETVGRKLRAATRRRVDYTAWDTRVRLAKALVELAEDYGRPAPSSARGIQIGVNLTQIELGTLVGASESAAQRALRELRNSGLITTEGRRPIIPSLDALRRAATPEPPGEPVV